MDYLPGSFFIRCVRHQHFLLSQHFSHNDPTYPNIYFSVKGRHFEHNFGTVITLSAESLGLKIVNSLNICQSEVKQFGTSFGDQYVGFLQISMHNLIPMTELQSHQNIPYIPQPPPKPNTPNNLRKRHSKQILKDQPKPPTAMIPNNINQRHNIRTLGHNLIHSNFSLYFLNWNDIFEQFYYYLLVGEDVVPLVYAGCGPFAQEGCQLVVVGWGWG